MTRKTKFDDLQNIFFYAMGVVVFCAFVFLTVWGDDGLMKLVTLRAQKQKLSQRNVELLQENLLYLEEIEKLQQPRYVEQIVRNELGLVKNGETVYIIR